MADLRATSRWRSSHRLWLIVVVVVLGLLAVVSQLPRLLIPSVEEQLSSALGTPVRLASLSFSPLRGAIAASVVQIGEGDAQVRIEQVDVHLVLRRLLERQVVIDRLTIDAPRWRLGLDDQGRPRLPVNVAGGPAASSPAPVALQEVLVRRGDITLEVAGGTALVLRDVEMRLTDIELPGTSTSARAHVHATAAVAGGSIVADGSLALGGAVNEVHLTAEAEHLALAEIVASQRLPAATGTASVKLAFKQDAKTQSLQVSGTVDNPRLAGRDGAVLTAHRLTIDELVADLTKRRLKLGTIQLVAPNLVIGLTATKMVLPIDFGDSTPSAADAKTAWQVLPGKLQVRQGELTIGTQAKAPRLHKLDADWAGAAAGKTAAIKVTAATDGDGRVSLEGDIGFAPLAGSIAATITGLDIAALTATLPPLAVPIAKGSLDAELHADLGTTPQRLQGSLNLHSLHTAAPSAARAAEVLAVHQAQGRFELEFGEPWTLRVPWLRLQDPYIMVHRDVGGIFPYTLVAADSPNPPVAGSPAVTGASAARPRVQVDRVEVFGGRVEFTDGLVDPPFWTAFNIVEASADRIGVAPFAVERLEISGWHDELSPVKLTGSWQPNVVALNLAVERFYLETLNPYLSPLLGYRTTGGLLSLQVEAREQSWPVSMDNQAVLSEMQLVATGVDAIQARSGIALPIALSLLEGLDRRTRLSALITIAAGGKVDWGDLVSAAIARAIEGALAWPLKILGDLFRGKQSPYAFAIDPVPFEVGRASLDDKASRRVAEIVRVLGAHPNLAVVLQAQLTAADIAAVGEAGAAGLAAGRVQATRAALTQPGAPGRVDAARILIGEWAPNVGAGATGRPGVYVEIQQK